MPRTRGIFFDRYWPVCLQLLCYCPEKLTSLFCLVFQSPSPPVPLRTAERGAQIQIELMKHSTGEVVDVRKRENVKVYEAATLCLDIFYRRCGRYTVWLYSVAPSLSTRRGIRGWGFDVVVNITRLYSAAPPLSIVWSGKGGEVSSENPHSLNSEPYLSFGRLILS